MEVEYVRRRVNNTRLLWLPQQPQFVLFEEGWKLKKVNTKELTLQKEVYEELKVRTKQKSPPKGTYKIFLEKKKFNETLEVYKCESSVTNISGYLKMNTLQINHRYMMLFYVQ